MSFSLARYHRVLLLLIIFFSLCFTTQVQAQGLANSGSTEGKVSDSTGAVIPGATVTISNPVTGYRQTGTTDNSGQFRFSNVPYNRYHLSATATGFSEASKDVDIRSAIVVQSMLTLQIAAGNQTVTVEATTEDLLENTPIAHTDISRDLIEKLPLPSTNSSIGSLITLASPGVSGDSNGFFHPLGEHMEQQFSLDGQPVTDQQARFFSNPPPVSAIESMEVIDGIPPAEFGDKQSLVVRTTTRSGLNANRPTGSLSTSYGSFGTANTNLSLGMGNKNIGNFLAVDGTNSGRFLDTPEFQPLHAHGNAENLFDRFDYQFTPDDNFHLNLSVQRSWFQVPNQYDQQAAGQDQRQQNKNFNFAPSYTHIFNQQSLISTQAWVRQDRITFYPSDDPFADTPATMAFNRRLTNSGIKSDYSYVKGRHNAKFGVQFQHTFLSEAFQFGITDPSYITDNPGLAAYDLTNGGSKFDFTGHADIKEEAVYAQDSITFGNLTASVGLRFDNYNGLSSRYQFEPRAGVSYQIKPSGTILRIGYGREMVTPFNEFLVLSSTTGQGGLAQNVLGANGDTPLTPGTRHHFTAGFQQAIGKYLVIDADYFWKYTHGDFDFDVLFNSPVTFPIQWNKSKIDGLAMRVSMPQWHGVSAYSVIGHARSRFFNPEIGGIIFNSPTGTGAFRIDHDQAFQQTTHVQYQFSPKTPWVGFTWRYDSGMVAGAIPDLATAFTLTGDQQGQIGFYCGSDFASNNNRITSCPVGTPVGATRIRIPAEGTANDDSNPARIAPRHMFDMAAGMDNILHRDRVKTNLRFTVTNLTNKVGLYNILSTFSGTHFVAPRSYSGELGFTF